MMMRFTFCLMLAAASTLCTTASAIPDSEDVNAMLTWSQVPETKTLYDEVTSGYQELLATVEKYAAPKRPLQLTALGKTQARVLALHRKSLHLAQLGEPAGHDLHLRLTDLVEANFKFIDIAQETPAGQKMLARINLSLPTFSKELQKTQQAM